MTERQDSHQRLEALRSKITAAREALERKNALTDGHRLSSGELEARYAFLKNQLKADISDMEAHATHVNALEESVLGWLEYVEFDLRRPD